MVKYVKIEPSDSKGKKYKAIFYDKDKVKLLTTHFGAKGYSDFTQHNDNERKKNYLLRHQVNQNWDDFTSAGALSRWILWNKKNLRESIDDYLKRFSLKKY